MSLEEQLDIAMKQRAMLAACVVGAMQSPTVSEDSIKIKDKTMMVIMAMFADGETFGDAIEHELLLSSKAHCVEQMQIIDLLESL